MQDTTLRIVGRKNTAYKMRGISVHRGQSMQGGHYTAFFRSSDSLTQWFYANDSHVRPA